MSPENIHITKSLMRVIADSTHWGKADQFLWAHGDLANHVRGDVVQNAVWVVWVVCVAALCTAQGSLAGVMEIL